MAFCVLSLPIRLYYEIRPLEHAVTHVGEGLSSTGAVSVGLVVRRRAGSHFLRSEGDAFI